MLKELILQNYETKSKPLLYISGETISVDLDKQLLNEGYNIKRIINYPARGIGDTTLQKLIITAEQKNCTIWEIIEQIEGIDIKINNGLVNKLVNFRTLIQSYSAETKSKDAYNITEHIIKSSGIYSALSLDKSPEGTNRF